MLSHGGGRGRHEGGGGGGEDGEQRETVVAHDYRGPLAVTKARGAESAMHWNGEDVAGKQSFYRAPQGKNRGRSRTAGASVISTVKLNTTWVPECL